jgi:beta-aspartyl-peptidase (threonine type)
MAPQGLWLEIVPFTDLCAVRMGDAVTFQVLFEGKPLAGVRLAAGYAGVTGHGYPVWLRTDAAGKATVTLDRPGAWFVRTLHMIEARGQQESDWESAFSTFTFAVLPKEPGGDRSADRQDAAAAVRELLEMQAEAWNRGDLEGFLAGYWNSPNLTFAGAGGITRGWAAVRERYRRSYPGRGAMGRLTFSDLEITELGPAAVFVLGRWQLERAEDRPGGVFTLIVREFPEGWRIVHDHTSAFPPNQQQ